MPKRANAGFPIVGVIFLALAVMKFINGDHWVVWALLAFVFGGFGIFTMRSGSAKSGDETAGGDKA
jgi:hypothetical protein